MKRRKKLRCLKKMRRAGVRAWKKKRSCKWQTGCMVLLVSVLCMSSYRGSDSWQEIRIDKKEFIKKDLIREQQKLERTGNKDDLEKPVLKEGAAFFLKEGKLLFFRIREEEKKQRPTD